MLVAGLCALGGAAPAAAQITPVCERTPEVRDEIVRLVPNKNDCAEIVPEEDFGLVTNLDFANAGLTELKRGDFDGLWALEFLNLGSNTLESLPSGLFSRLQLELPVDPLDPNAGTRVEESSLEEILLDNNRISSLPSGLFSSLPSLVTLRLSGNRLTSVGGGLFSGLERLDLLDLSNNRIASLSANAFRGSTALRRLDLPDNLIGALPPGFFLGLTLVDLDLRRNRLESFPNGLFVGPGGFRDDPECGGKP